MFENPKGSPFKFFRHYETIQNCHFHLTLGFLNTYPPIFFFNTTRNLNVNLNGQSAISEFLTLFPKYIPFHWGGGGGSKTSARICPSRYIRTSEAFSQHGRVPLGETFL